MEPSIRERLGLKPPSAPQVRERAEAAMAARSLMYVFLVGALVAGAALVSPVSAHLDMLRIALTGGCSAMVAAILFVGYERIPQWSLSVCLLCGSMLIEWAIYAGHDPTSPFLLFYLWVAFYAFYFLNRIQAALQIGFIGFAYAIVLAVSDEPLKAQIVRWIVFTIALVVAGLLVRVMRERIDALLGSLDDVMRKDMLTGLLDERGFDELLEKEIERARRSGNRLGVVIGQLDGSGSVRDRLGRRADEVLARVGKTLGGTIRLNDEAARVDDELFAIVCPYTDERGAAIMAERIGTLIREDPAAGASPETASFGVGCYPKHGASADTLLRAVRHALSEARALGGDRTVTFYSAENSIEDRLRGSAVELEVLTAEPGQVEDGFGVASPGSS
ncbi:MAG: two-component system, cell cycle response regulator [Thermoleophilaceae bacterium]|jgi:diguanylate cyclase (GGDEF)-like protein|nr:two-component system, cell cycle response regulator [Thermoleophilaceae bacterium]